MSAQNDNNNKQLITLMKDKLPYRPKYYDDNQLKNRSARFMNSEIIREKVLTHTKEEVPHSINVIVETMEQTSKQKLHIQATIITERESQKGILKIGRASCRERMKRKDV